jgi:hypothetical protein
MCETTTAKSESKDNSSPNRHFTIHLASVFKELSRESNLNIKISSFLIRWLKTIPAFTLQVSSPIRKYQTEQQTIGESGKSEKKILTPALKNLAARPRASKHPNQEQPCGQGIQAGIASDLSLQREPGGARNENRYRSNRGRE